MEWKNSTLNLILVVVSIFFALLFAEGAFRLFSIKPVAGDTLYLANPFYYYGLKPNLKIADSFGVPVFTNEDGLREQRTYQKEPKRKKRILVLGDSYTFGLGVKSENTYPKQLEQLLSGAEVVNAGVSGFTAWQEMRFFQYEGYKYQPDLVIIGLVMNDLSQTKFCDSRGYIYDKDNPMELEGKPTFYDYLIDNSYLLKVVLSRVELLKEKFWPHKIYRDLTLLYDLPPATLSKAVNYLLIKYYQSIKIKANCEVLIVILPLGKQILESNNYQQIVISQELIKAGFPTIDILPQFKKHSLEELYNLKNDYGHFNSLGHQLIAREIYQWLKEKQPDFVATED